MAQKMSYQSRETKKDSVTADLRIQRRNKLAFSPLASALAALETPGCLQAYPKEVRTDNGPEFACRAFMTWTQRHGIKHILIEPGSPTQNAYIESFNGTFHDECLDENWFESLEQARQIIATWRIDYNEI